MNRLTERNKYKAAYYPYCFKENTCDGKGTSKKCDYCEFSTMVCERLAEYEDTGLTPEQIIAMDKEYMKMAKELGEYKRLEEAKNHKPQTNADRIRNMTDEELAEFWEHRCDEVIDCKVCEEPRNEYGSCTGQCRKEYLRWLQKEVE